MAQELPANSDLSSVQGKHWNKFLSWRQSILNIQMQEWTKNISADVNPSIIETEIVPTGTIVTIHPSELTQK
jgi:hypothetical protein